MTRSPFAAAMGDMVAAMHGINQEPAMPNCNRPDATEISDLRTPAERFNAQAAENEADDLDYLADQLDSWAQDLEDAYRIGMSDEAAGLHDTLSNLAGALRKKADTAREGW